MPRYMILPKSGLRAKTSTTCDALNDIIVGKFDYITVIDQNEKNGPILVEMDESYVEEFTNSEVLRAVPEIELSDN